MREFWVKFLTTVLLLAATIYDYIGEDSLFLVMLVFTGFLTIYFLLPLTRKPLYLYTALILTLFILPLINTNHSSIYPFFLLIYILIDGLFRLAPANFKIFIFIHMASVILWMSMEPLFSFELLLLILFVYVLAWNLNRERYEKHMKQDLYETLLGEFRKLKRFAYEAERAARLEERTKIARDIHDSVGHKLTALIMKLQVLGYKENHPDYEELKKLAADSLDETRQAVRALKTEEEGGFASVLQLIRKLESESHIILDLTIRKGVLTARLSNKQNIALYRIIQEALTNAMRHSRSREVKVVFRLNAVGNLEFTAENKVEPHYTFSWGFGLTGMKERMEEMNGRFDAYISENRFIVEGMIPLEARIH